MTQNDKDLLAIPQTDESITFIDMTMTAESYITTDMWADLQEAC